MASNNDYLNDIASKERGIKRTNNQLLEQIAAGGGTGGANGVTSVNGKTKDVSIIAGDNVTVDNSGESIVISSQSSGSGGVVSVNGKTGTVVLDAEDVGATTQSEVDASISNALDGKGYIESSTMPLVYEYADKNISMTTGEVGQVLGTIEDPVLGPTVAWTDAPGVAEAVEDITNGGGSSTTDIEQKINEILAALRNAGLMEE